MKNRLIKLLSTSLLLTMSFAAISQTKVTDLPTLTGDPSGGWMLINKDGLSRKIDAANLGVKKLDSIFLRNDTLFSVKNGSIVSFNALPSFDPALLTGQVNHLIANEDTAVKSWVTNQNYLKTYTEIDSLSVHIADSLNMLLPYLRKIDTTNKWAAKVHQHAASDVTSGVFNPARLGDIPAGLTVDATSYLSGTGWTKFANLVLASISNNNNPVDIYGIGNPTKNAAWDYVRFTTGQTLDNNIGVLLTSDGGGGAPRGFGIVAGGPGARLFLGSSSLPRWWISSNYDPQGLGHWLPYLDNTYDIGALTNRVRTIYTQSLNVNGANILFPTTPGRLVTSVGGIVPDSTGNVPFVSSGGGSTGNTKVYGTANRITITSDTAAGYTANIASNYDGQISIKTVGTITQGIWNGTPLADASIVSAQTWNTHIANMANPHGVTITQLGYGNINNTSDADKPISTLTAKALAAKLNIPTPITPSTGTKITYDANGLVKSSTTLAVSDIPTVNQNTTGTASNITGVLNASSHPALQGDVTTTAGSLATTISANVVTTAKIMDGSVTTAKITDGSVTATKIAPSVLAGKQNILDLFGGIPWGLGNGVFRLAQQNVEYMQGMAQYSTGLIKNNNGGSPSIATLGTDYSNQTTTGQQVLDTIKKYGLSDTLGLDVSAPGKHTVFRKDSLTIGSRGLVDGDNYSWTYPTPNTIGLNITASGSSGIRDTVPTIGSNNGVTSDAVATALADKASLGSDVVFTKSITIGNVSPNASYKFYTNSGNTNIALFESSNSAGGNVKLYRTTLPTSANQRIQEILFGTSGQSSSGIIGMYADSPHIASTSLPTDFAIKLTPKNSTVPTERFRINSDGSTNINGSLSLGLTPDISDSSNAVQTTAGTKQLLAAYNTGGVTGSGYAYLAKNNFFTGKMGIGASPDTVNNYMLNVVNASNTNTIKLQSNHTNGAYMKLESPIPSASDKRLGEIGFSGRDAVTSASILASSDGAWNSGVSQPSRLSLWTTPSGSITRVNRLTINNAGDALFTGNISANNYGGVLNNPSALASPGFYSKGDGVAFANTGVGYAAVLKLYYPGNLQPTIIADAVSSGNIFWQPNSGKPVEKIWTDFSLRSNTDNDIRYAYKSDIPNGSAGIPTATLGLSSVVGGGATVALTTGSNDLQGIITINTGSNPAPSVGGLLVTLTTSANLGNAVVILYPASSQAADQKTSGTYSNGAVKILAYPTPLGGASLIYNYIVQKL